MCYAIPGKVVEINDKIITVEYFGEQKKARNEFYNLALGEYIYAQGGLVIQRISEREALPVLESWKEMFHELAQVDKNLARETKTMYEKANAVRHKYSGNSCCVHGIIEFSNYCKHNCLYCGLRKDNKQLKRYQMEPDEIIQSAADAINLHGFKALVLQSGEDDSYTAEIMGSVVKSIMEKTPILLILSVGEKDISFYKRLYDEGARGVLLRFETSNPQLYKKMKPDSDFNKRLELIKQLRDMGYLIFTGFLAGLPGQTREDLENDIKLTTALGTDMFSFGPFIPHPQTPLANENKPSLELALNAIAKARLACPEAKILVTTSLETLDKENGAKSGLMAGGNSLMINLTPEKYRKLYEIYPQRAGTDIKVTANISRVIALLRSIGRAPTDLGI
ncbi:MAG: [FeFe] hydrogenase H-cluster radical SAM maturase HydE [Elusimicrobia bacterium RIFOXYA2_FULL_39_19]|nr:MAG: [FeFe] hydrogenase H-cluster radical SAM maturase HydE [Elusimicrobia bacterium RIFOXYA2_FULL_39_19]